MMVKKLDKSIRRWADKTFGFSSNPTDSYFNPKPVWARVDNKKVRHSSFSFFWKGIEIKVPESTSDGYTLYDWIKILSFGLMKSFDSGVEAAFLHDYLCRNLKKLFIIDGDFRALTRKERAEIFRCALQATGKVNKAREIIMWRSVLFATKHLGVC